jgi:REP element-mobilizing transposase RayT
VSRPLRLEFEGAVWHVTSRGNDRRPVFRDDRDREAFLSVLGRTVGLFRWRLHAFVLMRNHYHLLVETPEPTLSRGMRQLNGLFTQAFNRRHRRAGHVFQGRFRSILVERDAHLLELCRYLALNPVRAKAAKSARDFPWSSFGATAGLAPTPPWLETDWTLRQFGSRRATAQEAFRRFVADAAGAAYEPWKQLRGQIYLGSGDFLANVERRAAGREATEIPRRQRRPRETPLDGIVRETVGLLGVSLDEMNRHPRRHVTERRLLAHTLRTRGLFRLEEIGAVLGVKAAQASSLVRGGEKLAHGGDRRGHQHSAGRQP